MHEFVNVRTDIEVRRWNAEQTLWVAERVGLLEPKAFHFDDLGVEPYFTTLIEDANLITLSGWAALLGGIAGTTIATKFSSTAGRIGVGTISTAAAPGDLKLGGDTGGASTTSYYQLVSQAPVIQTATSPSTLVFNAAFGGSVANFAWNEFGIDNGTASGVTTSGVFINHAISAQGTKTSGQTWNVTATMNFGYPSGAGTVT